MFQGNTSTQGEASDSIDDMMRRARSFHIASVFRSESEQYSSAVPFILAGLENGDKCVYVTDRSSRESVVNELMKVRDIQNHLDAGHLTFMSRDETYLKGGHFDMNRMLGLWRETEKRALAEGYAGLRGTGEMSWYTSKKPGVENLVEYEARVNSLYPEIKPSFLCQYDEPSFDHSTMLDVVRVHPKVVIKGELCTNPYFMTPDEFLSFKRGEVSLETYEKTTRDILKRAHLSMIKRLELKDLRLASRKLTVLGGFALDDMRSQIAVVGFYNELALESCNDNVTRSYLAEIARKCSSIEKRLDFAMSYQHLGEPTHQWRMLSEVLEHAITASGGGNVKVVSRVKGAKVLADGILEKAIQAMMENIPDRKDSSDEIELGSYQSGDELIISLKHAGNGIPESYKERLFESGKSYGQSDGYCLFLAAEMLRSAGMTAREVGAPGKCTKFEIVIPNGRYAIEA